MQFLQTRFVCLCALCLDFGQFAYECHVHDHGACVLFFAVISSHHLMKLAYRPDIILIMWFRIIDCVYVCVRGSVVTFYVREVRAN